MRCVTCLLVVLIVPVFAFASGHGPIFGLATPTNSQGEWSFDEGIFGRTSGGRSVGNNSRTDRRAGQCNPNTTTIANLLGAQAVRLH